MAANGMAMAGVPLVRSNTQEACASAMLALSGSSQPPSEPASNLAPQMLAPGAAPQMMANPVSEAS